MKQRIIACAMELFAESGIKSVTMDTIAQQMGISKRTLYEHFDCKENLLAECLEIRLETKGLFAASDAGLLEELIALYLSIRQLDIDRAGRFYAELQHYYNSVAQDIITRQAEYADRCAEKVMEGVEYGYIRRDISPEIVRMAVSAYLSHLLSEATYRLNVLVPDTILIFARGISTIKGRAYLDNRLKTIKNTPCNS